MTGSGQGDEELRKVLQHLAVSDAPGVLDRARRRAVARAEQLIEDALVEELMDAVAQPRPRGVQAADVDRPDAEPAASEPAGQGQIPAEPAAAEPAGAEPVAAQPGAGEAWWTYCIMRGAEVPAEPLPLEGVEPGSSVEIVCDGDLAALVSSVPLPDYGDERLRGHLEDLAWVERTARRHEDVLEAALRDATIVPLRLCTLYTSRDGVRRLLREHRAALRDGLGRVDGCLEWAVKVFFDPGSSLSDMPDEADGSETRGVAYLQRRQQERALADKAGEVRARCVEVVHQQVEGLARASTVNPPQRPEVHGRELTMLFNGAYLIERDRTSELREAVEALHEEWCSLGFMIELTGPWPPYNFVSGAAGVMS